MAKHIYDEDGNYKGKILSDEEHSKRRVHHRRFTNNLTDKQNFNRGCAFLIIMPIIFILCCYLGWYLGSE